MEEWKRGGGEGGEERKRIGEVRKGEKRSEVD